MGTKKVNEEELPEHDYDGCFDQYCGFNHVTPYSTRKLYVFCKEHLEHLPAIIDFEDHLQVEPCPKCKETHQARVDELEEALIKIRETHEYYLEHDSLMVKKINGLLKGK